jgi:hypothetical protein
VLLPFPIMITKHNIVLEKQESGKFDILSQREREKERNIEMNDEENTVQEKERERERERERGKFH